jgi:hypothetical protein
MKITSKKGIKCSHARNLAFKDVTLAQAGGFAVELADASRISLADVRYEPGTQIVKVGPDCEEIDVKNCGVIAREQIAPNVGTSEARVEAK